MSLGANLLSIFVPSYFLTVTIQEMLIITVRKYRARIFLKDVQDGLLMAI